MAWPIHVPSEPAPANTTAQAKPLDKVLNALARGAFYQVPTTADLPTLLTALAAAGEAAPSAATPVYADVLDTGAMVRNAGAGWKTIAQPSTSYTPALTSTGTAPTLGTGGLVSGRYSIAGGRCSWEVEATFGTGATAGSGEYRLSLPVAAAGVSAVGSGYLYAGGGVNFHNVVAQRQTPTIVRLLRGVGTLDYWGASWVPAANGAQVSLSGSFMVA